MIQRNSPKPWSIICIPVLLVALTACASTTQQSRAPEPVVPTEIPTQVAQGDSLAVMTGRERPTTALGVDLDTVRAGRFDDGKMWTFEYPPLGYFAETYGFAPDSAWFAQAHLGALRLPNCTASFVSPNGLVLTNHHCARESVTEVAREGEELLDEGFYALSASDERYVEELHADQLIAIRDVSKDMEAALVGVLADSTRARVREETSEAIQSRILDEYGGDNGGHVVEVVSLWDGAKYSAYIFRRYTDLRLVLAPELQIGFYGGDPDNFTYPRYNLDMSFFRVYGDDDRPLRTDHFFKWSEAGPQENNAVFVIGNPGSTNRLQTVAQLEFRRDVQDKAILDLISSRADALQAFADGHPQETEELDLRNSIFSLRNSQKAYRGMWEGLHDPVIMAKRRDSERQFRSAINGDPSLRAKYADLLDRMARIQQRKRELAADYRAFVAVGSPSLTSTTLLRGLNAFQYLSARDGGAPPQVVAQMKEGMLGVEDQPKEMQVRLLTARLRDFQRAFGAEDPLVRQVLADRTPEAAAEALVTESALSSSATTATALEAGTLSMSDPAIQAVSAFLPRLAAYQGGFRALLQEEGEVTNRLGRARFDVYGTKIPPDATFSLRIADGVVKGYDYNGTVAPTHTTFYGLYDRFYGHSGTDWDLPMRWLSPPASFDLSTPVNFVLTADIIGGNSGSPVLNQNLELVGLIFDGNIESLPGDYIYDPRVNRAVAVDSRGILEALDDIYDADRIVLELTTGRMVPTEAEADAAMAATR
jgi:hypothetical protein